ncbi:hypothetical protein ANCDUO_02097 [Ancylostoma duodenale]|uniref:DDE Tnp4 domain-containing protein n=1 Tax=Ancylostoma duodenale TaxID=51022 RepID=A0A0C2H1E0_9BILA|nr:hypothetical protein ANCDUO_02097 [Ancylostoma duodenale]
MCLTGAPGRGSDAGVFGNSSVKSFLEGHFDDFPGPVQLPNVGKVRVKHHILVDQGFRQTIRFIRPFISADSISDIKKAYFNKNLSGYVSDKNESGLYFQTFYL